MKLEIYNITIQQMKQLILSAKGVTVSDDEMRSMESVAHFSRPLLAGMYGDELLAVFGFVPQTVISDTAHLWVYTTPAVDTHRTIFARTSKSVIDNMLEQYPEIVGYCFTTKAMIWLRWLGAEFSPPRRNAHPFTIRRA
jgi:hypothetical protein